jgi:hypothetical protein
VGIAVVAGLPVDEDNRTQIFYRAVAGGVGDVEEEKGGEMEMNGCGGRLCVCVGRKMPVLVDMK